MQQSQLENEAVIGNGTILVDQYLFTIQLLIESKFRPNIFLNNVFVSSSKITFTL